MVFLVYETKFTVEKYEMVFTAGKRRGRWGIDIWRECLDKTLGNWALQRLENLLASKHWVLEALLLTISDFTAFWHVRSFHFILELNRI